MHRIPKNVYRALTCSTALTFASAALADSRLVDLPPATNLVGPEIVYGVQNGQDSKITAQQLQNFFQSTTQIGNLPGSIAPAQMPAIGGDVTCAAGTTTCAVQKIENGVPLDGGTISPVTGNPRTTQARAQDERAITDFPGVDKTGTTDSSAGIQAALNSGDKSIFVPPGTYKACNLTMPAVLGFVLHGAGAASTLSQAGCSSPVLRWPTTSIAYNEQEARDLGFVGTTGAAHTIDTTGAGGVTLKHLFFIDVPPNFCSIFVNGAASTYTHDIRVEDIRIYSNTAGFCGVRLGPYSSDQSITDLIMNGNFLTQYGVYMDSGATSLRMSDSHPYNVTKNIVYSAGGAGNLIFDANTFDNAQGDLVSLTGTALATFSGNYFEAINAGRSGAVLSGTTGVSFSNTMFAAAGGAVSAVRETGGANTTQITGGNISVAANYSKAFDLSGTGSYRSGVQGDSPLGLRYFFGGVTTAPQGQNTTTYLGANSAQSSALNTAYVVPANSTMTTVSIATDQTPAAGQSFVFTVYDGETVIGTLTVSNGQYGGTIQVNAAVASGDQVYIKSVTSATSGSTNVRWTMSLAG